MDWVKQFVEMLYPLDNKKLNIEGAFLLKNRHLPESIFKYRSVNENAIKNLEDDTIWLADPSNFNDPYDCAHTVDFHRVEEKNALEIFKYFMADKGKKIPLTDKQRESLRLSHDPMGELVDILISDCSVSEREKIKSLITILKEKMYEDLSLANSKSTASYFKLCSFSERYDSMLMWSHYSSYHQGFCIEYDLEKFSYSDYRRRFLYPTIYSDNLFDATEHLMKDIEDESFNNLHPSLAALIKAKDWAYEKEWRLVFGHGIFDTERAYNIGKPARVYLGAKISPENQARLIEICTRKDIPVSKMKAHHSEFKLISSTLKEADMHFFKKS